MFDNNKAIISLKKRGAFNIRQGKDNYGRDVHFSLEDSNLKRLTFWLRRHSLQDTLVEL